MLNLIATSNIMLDAQQLYDPAFHDEHAAEAAKCHIYMIGHTPTVKFENAFQDGKTAYFAFTVSGENYQVPIDLPPGAAIILEAGPSTLWLKWGRWPSGGVERDTYPC